MSEPMNGKDGHVLLLAAGFQEAHHGHHLFLVQESVNAGNGESETRILRVGGPDISISFGESTSYHAVVSSSLPYVKHVEFDTDDARDIVALVIALRNEGLIQSGDQGAIPDEDGFVSPDDTTFITSPFLGGQYADYVLDREPTATGIHLADPKLEYGDSYIEWRNKRAEQILREAAIAAPSI